MKHLDEALTSAYELIQHYRITKKESEILDYLNKTAKHIFTVRYHFNLRLLANRIQYGTCVVLSS